MYTDVLKGIIEPKRKGLCRVMINIIDDKKYARYHVDIITTGCTYVGLFPNHLSGYKY